MDCVTFVAFVRFSEFVFISFLIYLKYLLLDLILCSYHGVFLSICAADMSTHGLFLERRPKMVQASGPSNFELTLSVGNEQ